MYYLNHNPMDHLILGELGQCLQPYSSVSCPVSKESAPQPEMLMVGKEIQSRDALIPISTSGFSYSTSGQNMPDISLPGKYKLRRERHMIKRPRMLKSTFHSGYSTQPEIMSLYRLNRDLLFIPIFRLNNDRERKATVSGIHPAFSGVRNMPHSHM